MARHRRPAVGVQFPKPTFFPCCCCALSYVAIFFQFFSTDRGPQKAAQQCKIFARSPLFFFFFLGILSIVDAAASQQSRMMHVLALLLPCCPAAAVHFPLLLRCIYCYSLFLSASLFTTLKGRPCVVRVWVLQARRGLLVSFLNSMIVYTQQQQYIQ